MLLVTDALWVPYLCCLLDFWFNADKYAKILHHLGEFGRVRLALVLHVKHKTHGQAVLDEHTHSQTRAKIYVLSDLLYIYDIILYICVFPMALQLLFPTS